MFTFENPQRDVVEMPSLAPIQDGIDLTGFHVVETPLPIIGRMASAQRPMGIALAFSAPEAASGGEDQFSLLVIDEQGEVLYRLGPFGEDDIVAQWRDFSAKSGLPRMILREGGGVSTVSQQLGRVALGTKRQRRRHGLLNGRRPRFLTRRKSARLPARPLIHRGENEIIARS